MQGAPIGLLAMYPWSCPSPFYLPLGRAVLIVILGRAEFRVYVDVIGSVCSLPACSDLEGTRCVEDKGDSRQWLLHGGATTRPLSHHPPTQGTWRSSLDLFHSMAWAAGGRAREMSQTNTELPLLKESIWGVPEPFPMGVTSIPV